MRALQQRQPFASLLLWLLLLDSLSIGLGAPRSAKVEGISEGKSIGDLSHGLEGLLAEGDGSELRWEEQQQQSPSEGWSPKLGSRLQRCIATINRWTDYCNNQEIIVSDYWLSQKHRKIIGPDCLEK